MKNFVKITVFSMLFALFLSLPALSQYKKQVSYPLGFKHGMGREEAGEVLKNLNARIVENSEQAIHAAYGKRYFGVIIKDIDLNFSDDQLQSVSLRSDGEKSDEKNRERLDEFANLIRAIYKVNERPNGPSSGPSSVDTTSDIKTRFVSRYENGSYELLIYSYYLNDKYYLTVNFEKVF